MVKATDLTVPGLVGIAFILRSREGPQFVYHYPPQPTGEVGKSHSLYGTEFDTPKLAGTVEIPKYGPDDESDFEIDDEEPENPPAKLSPLDALAKLDLNDTLQKEESHGAADITLEDDYHHITTDGEHIVPWEQLLDFPTIDLGSILTPSRAYSKQMFDLKLDPFHFVSYPVHIREDGLWVKKKTKKTKKKKSADTDASRETKATNGTEDATGNKAGESSRISEDGDESMTMFNVVFILRVPRGEAHARVDEMFEHVAKKFNKALVHAQGSSNYVWNEAQLIMAMKEKAKEKRRPMSWLWADILQKSTLAGAMRNVFLAVSKSEIATVHLGTTPPLDLSLQIPIPAVLMSIPTNTEQAMPGIILCSSPALVSEEGEEEPTCLNKHFALLLLDDEATIIADIKAEDTDISGPLIECIRLCKPTLSFLQVAQTSQITLSSLLVLAQHLIFWRKAVAIPPLHGRHSYIVSPNCDVRNLKTAVVEWKKAFPFAPSLPNFLGQISERPVPYKTFAPSKDHRPTYLEMVAWLMRNGWVTQNRLFGWILVWPEIVYEVQYQLKKEEIEKVREAANTNQISTSKSESDPDAPMSNEKAAERARLERLATKTAREQAEAEAAFAAMPVPAATTVPNTNSARHLLDISPYLIVDPHRLKPVETMYVAALGRRWTDPKAAACWEKWTKYFDGKEDWEMICLKENMKRKETWNVLVHFCGHLLMSTHF